MKKTILFSAMIITLMSCAANENNTGTTATAENHNAEDGIEISTQDKIEKIAENVKADKFQELIQNKDGIILDVRTPGEFQAGHIEGAINIDYYASDFEEQVAALDKTKPVYLYCKSGGRSGKAQGILSKNNFEATYNLIGGYSAWPYK